MSQYQMRTNVLTQKTYYVTALLTVLNSLLPWATPTFTKKSQC